MELSYIAVIPAIQEVEIEKTVVQGQPRGEKS
jgi:hypothetical protein